MNGVIERKRGRSEGYTILRCFRVHKNLAMINIILFPFFSTFNFIYKFPIFNYKRVKKLNYKGGEK